MLNASIVSDVARVQKAVVERAPRWTSTFKVLLSAQEMALKRFWSIHVLKPPYESNDEWMKNQAVSREFSNITVAHMLAPVLYNGLYSGIWRSLEYFRAIFNQLEGGFHQTHFQIKDTWLPEPGGFRELQDRVKRVFNDVITNLDNLKKAVSSEGKPLMEDHAKNALATMLLSPILYPAEHPPNAQEISILMEW